MSHLVDGEPGSRCLLMGNEAIARGALEAGVSVAAGYPGTPSSEIIETLARAAEARNLYVEWSANEKVALEVAAAASFAGLRSMAVMKQNGVNVASDFLLHLVGSGTRGGMVLVPCDDPGALSSINEGESRHFARLVEIPLLEPGGLGQPQRDEEKQKDTQTEADDHGEDQKDHRHAFGFPVLVGFSRFAGGDIRGKIQRLDTDSQHFKQRDCPAQNGNIKQFIPLGQCLVRLVRDHNIALRITYRRGNPLRRANHHARE